MGAALEFAVSEKLLGVVLPATDLLEDTITLSKALNMGLVVLVWSDRALTPATKSSLVRMRIDGLVSERIDFSLNSRTGHELFKLPLKEREKLSLPFIILDGGLDIVPRFAKTKEIGAGVSVEN
ncbi:unnamed protein product [Lymnaea stagnalis]|uniref:Uncharacterized protein n=1 Tax=Lymnaea stagnalis TaxID=6523 RepID=A0AAV2H581_LYMST